MKTLAFLLTLACGASALANCDGCPDWLYARGDFTHNPVTGQRVAQYTSPPPVEGLPDPREITSRYALNNTVLRGTDGSRLSIIDVQSFGNSRGGLDAQRERAFDASIEQLGALEPFRRNPWLFYGAAVGPGGGYGYGGGFGGGFGGGYGYGAPGGAFGPGPVPSGGFPPFGVPTQPYGGVGPYLPNFYGFGGFPFYGGPYGFPAYGPAFGVPGYGPHFGHPPLPTHVPSGS